MRPERGNTSRPPAVAGLFYPDDERELRNVVSEYLRQHSAPATAAPPKALIVPHAGYIYSGGIAAAAYAPLHRCGRSFAASCSSARAIASICAAWQCPPRARSQRRSE